MDANGNTSFVAKISKKPRNGLAIKQIDYLVNKSRRIMISYVSEALDVIQITRRKYGLGTRVRRSEDEIIFQKFR